MWREMLKNIRGELKALRRLLVINVECVPGLK